MPRPEQAELAPILKNHFQSIRDQIKPLDPNDPVQKSQRDHILIENMFDPRHEAALKAARATAEFFRETRSVEAFVPAKITVDNSEINPDIEQLDPISIVDYYTRDLESGETELTEDEEVSRWAYGIFDEYSQLPQTNSKERKVARRFLESAARSILEDPTKLETAGSTWRLISTDESGNLEEGSFYPKFQEAILDQTERNKEQIKHEQLRELIRTYSHSVLNRDLTEAILTKYFASFTSTHGHVGAYYELAFAAFELLDDSQSLRNAVRIGFYQTDILPSGSKFQHSIALSSIIRVDDDNLLGRANIAHTTLHGLYITYSQEEFEEADQKISNTKFSVKLQEEASRIQELVIRKIGLEEYQRRRGLVAALTSGKNSNIEVERRYMGEWPHNLTDNLSDALVSASGDFINRQRMAYYAREELLSMPGAVEDGKLPLHITVPLNDNFVFDLMIPESLIPEKSAIVKRAIENATREQIDLLNQSPAFFKVAGALIPVEFNGQSINFAFRRSTVSEEKRHPLRITEQFGFPQPLIEYKSSISEARIALAENIKQNRTRFLNTRGVRVPLQAKILQDLGYTAIEYRRDKDNAKRTKVSIFIGKNAYDVYLDENFNFDFEGKEFSSTIEPALHYAVLAPLQRILCDPAEEKNGATSENELGDEVLARCGHLKFLQIRAGKKYNFTAKAVGHLEENEGFDLFKINQERIEYQRRDGIPEDQIRNTTYVKPVIKEAGENLEPIVVKLPNVLRF